jgi:subtilisin family serine protease
MRRAATSLLLVVMCTALLGARPAGAVRQAPAINDPAYDQGLQWNLAMIHAEQGWAMGRGRGVTIAVIDSGIDLAHQDLAANIVGSVACIGTGGDAGLCAGSGADDDGHGTHVAGIAAAVANNGVGITGVAPEAKLLGVRVLTDHCQQSSSCSAEGDSADVAAGVRWAVARGARVINLSLGSDASPLANSTLATSLREAWARGAVVVIASGNATDHQLDVGDLPVVVVTAVNRQGVRADYANAVGNARWSLAAPGGEPGDDETTCRTGGQPRGVLSTYWDPKLGANQYACLSGTSMAAPHVSGALAVLLGAGFTPRQAVERLLSTADPIVGGSPTTTGAGLVDVGRAAAAGPPPKVTRAAPAPTATSTPQTAAKAAAGQPATPLVTGRTPSATGGSSRPLFPALAAAILIAAIALAQMLEARRRDTA